MNKQDILMVGVGGQGIVLASDILAESALATGYDVKKTDTLGMAQRGGSVISHLRIADHVWSPLINEGEADILLSFEKLEAARWGNYLRHDGLAIINNLSIPPLSVNLGFYKYPNDKEINAILNQQTENIYLLDGSSIANDLGDIRVLNMVMLGYISVWLSIGIDIWRNCIHKLIPSKILELNILAFDRGRKVASDANFK